MSFGTPNWGADGEILVVKDLILDVARGEFLTMLGPKGSGKTTVLMMLSGTRRVIDISADGRNNTGQKIRAVAPLAALSGVTVNGLAILNEVPTLGFYFEKYVIAGADAFAMEANDHHHYAVAILRKLIREIGNPAVT